MSQKELTKKEKEDIQAVLKKWGADTYWASKKCDRDTAGLLGLGAILWVPDLLATGGALTAMIIAINTGMAGIAYSDWKKAKKPASAVNTIGQTWEAPLVVRNAVKNMENKLSERFNAAALAEPEKKAAAEEELKSVAKEMTADLETLMPLIKITGGGYHNMGCEKLYLSVIDGADCTYHTTDKILRPKKFGL